LRINWNKHSSLIYVLMKKNVMGMGGQAIIVLMHLLIISSVSAGKHVAIFLSFCNLLCFG